MSRRRAGTRWRNLRAQVLQRDDHRCMLHIEGICTGVATSVDHLIPVDLWPDGEYLESNVVAACSKCNRRKSNRLDWRVKPREEVNPYDL
jgi:5-methylcytosine-specific restriction protein A